MPSRTAARLVVEALHDAVPLRRCTARLGRRHVAPADAPVCSAAQLGVAMCPCSGTADPAAYRAAVAVAERALGGDPAAVAAVLHEKMTRLAGRQRFEEAALVRDRLAALLGAVRRHHLVTALLAAGRAEITLGDVRWVVDSGRLVDAMASDALTGAVPVPPPDAPAPDRPLPRTHVDEALCLARFFDRRVGRLAVECSGVWEFPVMADDSVPGLRPAA